LRSSADASRADHDLSPKSGGVDAYTVAGTAADHFGNADRQLSAEQYPGYGPYVVLDTAGFTDGIPQVAGPVDSALSDLLNAVPDDLVGIVDPATAPCRESDIRC